MKVEENNVGDGGVSDALAKISTGIDLDIKTLNKSLTYQVGSQGYPSRQLSL